MLRFTILITLSYVNTFLPQGTSALIFSNETCVPLDKCGPLYSLATTKQQHFGALNLLQALYCNVKNRDFYVRCISSEKINEFIKKSELLPNFEDCGNDLVDEKISNGEKTSLDEFPWIALLKYRDNKGDFKYGCHANLISKKYLLTAAHCLYPPELKDKQLSLYSVVLGEYDIRTLRDCQDDECADPIQEFSIESYRLHPDYDSVGRANDIALFRIAGEVRFSDFVKPICLPLVFTELSKTDIWWVAGWGTTEKQILNVVKVKANFALRDGCITNTNLTANHLCVASVGNAKTCPGDSGGPLMMKKKIGGDVKVFLIGVDSLGVPDCTVDLKISIFMKTSAYVAWIISNLEE